MVKPFQFARLPLIQFGPDKRKLLTGSIKEYGNLIILVTDHKSFTGSSYADELFDSFKEDGIRYDHVIIPHEPSPEMIDGAVITLKDIDADAVVGIGGGSVLDAGKAISAMICMQGSVEEYLEGVGNRSPDGRKVPYIALPTTSGTGSEATKNAVISRSGKNGFKKSLRHDNYVPDIAIVDPYLTISCPGNITAASGMDCFTQLVESYLSDKSCEYTDALAWEGLRAIKSSLWQSYLNGTDIQARSDMSFAALTSGICLANAGLGAVHGFASSLGGMFEIPHGVVCGTLMAVANEVNVKELRSSKSKNPALKKYSALGTLFLAADRKSDDYFIDGFIEYLKELTLKLKLPRLSEYGILAGDIQSIIENTEIKNNPVVLGHEELESILYSRL